MSEEKQRQRRMTLSLRRAMPQSQREMASSTICEKIIKIPEIDKAQVVMSYAALWDEPDLAPVHEWLWQQGKTLLLPVVEGDGVMHAVKVTPQSLWKTGAYGIREPIGDAIAPTSIDVVLTPCVAFDQSCRRLGHGGGYYDRFLATCPQGKCIVIAFDEQRLDEVYTDANDRRADMIITEKETYVRR